MIDLVHIIEQCKAQREFFHNKKEPMPPLVIAYRENKPLAIVLAPELNKYQGLKAAQILRVTMAADVIIMMNDIYSYHGEKPFEEAKKGWPDGLMQKAVKQNVNAEGICEAINLACVNDKLQTNNVAVRYEIKNGKLHWMESTHEAIEMWKKAKSRGGFLFDSLLEIMKLNPTAVTEIAHAMGLTDPDKIRFHSDRGAIIALKAFGFTARYTGDQS